MRVRPAKKDDLVVCAELFRVDELRFIDGDYADVTYLERFLDERFFFVAEDDGVIVGAAYGEPLKAGGAVLWMVAVHPSRRSMGVGGQLVGRFEESCRADGREWVHLFALDTSRHERFYTGLGFRRGKTLVEYGKDF